MIEKSNYSVEDIHDILDKDLNKLLLMNENTAENIDSIELYLVDLVRIVKERAEWKNF